jgi:hypothetical protein
LLHVRLIDGRGDAPDHRAPAVAGIGANPVTFISAAKEEAPDETYAALRTFFADG